jgi:hypothetical protein
MNAIAGSPPGYRDWNAAISRHVFREEFAGRRVFLFVTEDDLDVIGRDMGAGLESFFRAVTGGPPGDPKAALVARRAVAQKDSWRRRRPLEGPPPYIAYLALFVIAAGTDDEDLPEHAYYPRLRRQLGLPETGGALPDFYGLQDVWRDLEKWSIEDMDGRLGIFRFQIAGGYVHVGVPRAQTLLTHGEIDSLPSAFAAAQLDPTAQPTDRELSQALERWGQQLRRRTRGVLQARSEDPLRGALLEVVRAELAEWDGEIADGAADGDGSGHGIVFGGLRLCLERHGGRWFSSLRCTLSRDYPAEPMILIDPGRPWRFVCEELTAPWSQRLRLEDQAGAFDASSVAWSEPIQLRDEERGWRLQMRGRRLRLFEDGETHGLPGLVETFRLERARPVYLACASEHTSVIERWGQEAASGFAEVVAPGALPTDWQLFRAAEVHDDAAIRSLEPSLAFPGHLGLRLVGGVRTGRGASYLGFAPPAVAIEGGDGSEILRCADRTLASLGPGLYALPDELPRGEHLVIDLVRDGEPVRRLGLVLRDEVAWTHPGPLRVDHLGVPVAPGTPGICGAYVSPELRHLARDFRPPIATPWPTAILVGAVPGQVARWPEEPLPRSWPPVWVIGPRGAGRGRRPLAFVGSSVAASRPAATSRAAKRRLANRWREVIWYWRKQVEAPSQPDLAALWSEYLEAARG